MGLRPLVLRCGGLFVVGVRTTWHTEGDGEFYCAVCGGDRNYLRRAGERRLTVLNVPLARRGGAGTVAECGTCATRHSLDALQLPTTARLTAMLREAVRTVTFTVLGAGSGDARALREAEAVLQECGAADDGDDLTTPPGTGDSGWLSIELHEALEPLACHLAPQGREHVLLLGARIALADGTYRPAERQALAAAGHCLGLPGEDTARILQAATAS